MTGIPLQQIIARQALAVSVSAGAISPTDAGFLFYNPDAARIDLTPALGVVNATTSGIPPAASSWVNVIDYGASANGTTDDTSACKLAIAALNSGDVLHFPAGFTYKVDTLTLNSLVDVTVFMIGAELLGDSTYGVAQTFDASACNSLLFLGGKFNRLRSTNPGQNRSGIVVRGCNDVVVDGANWYDVQYGLQSTKSGSTPSKRVGMRNCTGKTLVAISTTNELSMPDTMYTARYTEGVKCTNNTGYGMRLLFCSNATVTTTPFQQISKDIICTDNYIDTAPDTIIYFSNGCENIICNNNEIFRSGKDGMKAINGCKRIVFNNNYVEDMDQFNKGSPDGIMVGYDCEDGEISGNLVLMKTSPTGATQRGIVVDGALNVVVDGNNIINEDSSQAARGIHIRSQGSAGGGTGLDVNGVIVSDNYIYNCDRGI